MTQLAHDVLGSIVPGVHSFVSIQDRQASKGIIITRQSGVPLVELWPSLDSEQRAVTKRSLVALLVSMRMHTSRHDFGYYGRPGEQPYITLSEFGPNHAHSFCRDRSDWNSSRIRALYARATDSEICQNRLRRLERIQNETAVGAKLVDRPVLTHGDLSDRNILVDPKTFKVTGLIDWELGNVAPAYFEYVSACLCGGHQPEWRKELLDILRQVLRIECEREITDSQPKEPAVLLKQTLAAWNELVNVERPAQGFSDDCYWTFEHESQTIGIG